MVETLGVCSIGKAHHPEISKDFAEDVETYRIAEINLEPSRGSPIGSFRGGMTIVRYIAHMSL